MARKKTITVNDPHEFTETTDDASMCVCGVPALTHHLAVMTPDERKAHDAEVEDARAAAEAATAPDDEEADG